jgi:general bacterial porin, GBP family
LRYSKKWALALSVVSGIAHAQSSVSLYGTVSTGVVYSNNVSGRAYAGTLDNDHWNSTVGIKGTEDLGGGLSSIFNLQITYRPSTGALAGAGGCTQIFCKAYVGLSDRHLGAVTLGRQQDFTPDLLSYHANYYSSTLAANPGALTRFNSPGINNAIKYRNTLGPLTVGFMYALPDSAATGQPMSGRTLSALVTFKNGGFDAGAAWSSFSKYALKPWSATTGWGLPAGPFLGVTGVPGSTTVVPLDQLDVFGGGASYTYGSVRGAVGLFDVYMKGSHGESGSMPIVNGSVGYYLKPDLILAAGYWHANLPSAQSKYDNASLSLDYLFSKRTDVYIAPVYAHASGRGLAQQFMLAAASGRNQFSVDIGLKHAF